jgi:stage II sporulation protein D
VVKRTLLVLLGAAASAGCGDRYPPPALAATAPPAVRVLLGKERRRAHLEIPQGGWSATGDAGRPIATSVPSPLAADVTVGADGIALAGRETGSSVLVVRPPRTFTLDERTYAGTLTVRREGERLLFVNELDLETYVAGVIANELAPGATPAAFRAQAVAARTYAWMKVNDPGLADGRFHLYDTPRSQVYGGLTIPEAMVGQVTVDELFLRTAETRGVVLTSNGRPFRAWYSSTCGGHTTDAWTGLQEPDAGIEPLRGVACAFCGTSPKFAWDVTVSDEDLVAGFAREKRPIGTPVHSVEITERGRGGWVRWLRVTHGAKRDTKDVPGSVFRTVARLMSHRIERIERGEGGWRIAGGGWGHGVGMCQWGALEMGRQGFTETDILRHYYPGTSFTKVY